MKTKTNFINIHFIFTLMICIAFSACSKMNDLHDPYLKRGEAIYVSRLDTAALISGKNRVIIRCVNKDPKVGRILVYWRSRTDSMVVNLPENSISDTLELSIPNLPEGNQIFELITATKDSKFPSMPYTLSGNVYGETFQATLLDRPISSLELFNVDDKLLIKWFRAPQFAAATDITYLSTSGDKVVKRVPVGENLTEFNDVAGEVEYRTLFLPTTTSIDTFYTEYKVLKPYIVEGVKLDKTKFKRWNPTGLPYAGNTTAQWRIENAWDNTLTLGFANNTDQFTLDLGQTAKISQLILNSRKETNLIFNHAHARKFQIWGSATPGVTADLSGWTLLGEFESIKPSGSPLGTVTTDDIQYASDEGEKYYFEANSPDVRYIRFVCKETWGKIVGVQFLELTFTGVIKQ